MKVPHKALVLVADSGAEVGQLEVELADPLQLGLERLAGIAHHHAARSIRQQDPAGQRNGSTDLDELAHGAAIAEWLNKQTLNGGGEPVVIAADPKTLGQIRQHCGPQLQQRIVGELAKDLVNSPVAEIERALVNG